MELLQKYFPNLTAKQKEQFGALPNLYAEWNEKINVISRKDIENLMERHILHSLAIAETIRFKEGTRVLDVGTGGGFPGVPLAILFPETAFLLVDSIGKKIKVANAVIEALGLQNVTAEHQRVQQVKGQFDFVVSRAVTNLPELVKISRKRIKAEGKNGLPNGIICLKGGDLREELKPFDKNVAVFPIADFFEEEFFETKKVVYLPL
ncbi:MAG: 16S rRNA (guanine(527)-N(7))-methyltransferase RsmG [Flavobacteriaceae bacterium]|nr:16S rRNA (guanine(527)-N(7))-methyltransferase RsmG [Flavobacteriaceae bacterium]